MRKEVKLVASNSVDAAATAEQGDTKLRNELGKALGRLASGVFVVTVETDNGPQGMVATWIAQAAFEPPLVTIAINSQRPLVQNLQNNVLTVNVLSAQNMDIFKAFARPSKSAEDDRFIGLELAENKEGAVAFANAISALNCVVEQIVPAGDHIVVLARVVSGKLLNADAEPMIHLRKNGFQY